MHVIRAVVFTRIESAAFGRAQRLIDIAYPPKSDPLVQRSQDALVRAVADDDPRRKVLGGLRSPFDPVTRPRLVTAREVLTTLLAQVTKESGVEHWLTLAPDPTNPQTRQMAEVLASERTVQQRHVREALEIIDAALAQTSDIDDPRLSDNRHERT